MQGKHRQRYGDNPRLGGACVGTGRDSSSCLSSVSSTCVDFSAVLAFALALALGCAFALAACAFAWAWTHEGFHSAFVGCAFAEGFLGADAPFLFIFLAIALETACVEICLFAFG